MNDFCSSIIDQIMESLKYIDKSYYSLKQRDGTKVNKKIFERNFCYEFYHQMRANQSFDSILKCSQLVISPEIIKKNQGEKDIEHNRIPDFVIHEPGENNNAIIIEVKTDLNIRGIIKDFTTLCLFVDKRNYQCGLFILAGYSTKELKDKIKNSKSKEKQKFLKKFTKYDNVYILCSKNPGVVEKTVVLKELLKG